MKHSNTNMPCDTYGMLACSTSCSRYYECFKPATVPAKIVNKPLRLAAVDINNIIDALTYAADQTEESNGCIQAFCRDSENIFTEDENLDMAGEARILADKLIDMFAEGGFDVVIAEDK